jgi:protein TonB
MLDQWQAAKSDRTRLERLGVGFAIGGAGLAVLIYGASLVEASPPETPEPDTEVEVSLVETPEESKEEPEPEPEPAPDRVPAPVPTSRAPAPKAPEPEPGGGADDMYDAADAKAGKPGGGGIGPGTGSGLGGPGTAAAPPPPPPPAAPPPPPPPPPPPNPADYHPPKCKQRGIDPQAAKAIGVEGKVVVKYTVTATGQVTNVVAKSGPAELRALAVKTVSGWTCQPARMKSDDTPIQVTKNVPLTVRFQTD